MSMIGRDYMSSLQQQAKSRPKNLCRFLAILTTHPPEVKGVLGFYCLSNCGVSPPVLNEAGPAGKRKRRAAGRRRAQAAS